MKTKYLTIGVLFILIAVTILGYILTNKEPVDPPASLSEREAIDAIVAKYPELKGYETTDLPPSSIETLQTLDGWRVGFIQWGSGLPGILNAKCYGIHNDGKITQQGEYVRDDTAVADKIDLQTCEPLDPLPIEPVIEDNPSSDSGIGLDESVTYFGTTFKVLSVEEDSRCPLNVNCIQAGTVRVALQITSGYGTYVNTITLGQEFTTEDLSILLTEVHPKRATSETIETSEYRFFFSVTRREPMVTAPVSNTGEACYRGGCSGQLCSGQPDIVSTCEYREVYACYANATCERQPSGQCGWTESEELTQCINAAS